MSFHRLIQQVQDAPPHVTHVADTISAIAIVGSLAGALPPLAALAGIVWYCCQILTWYERRKERKAAAPYQRRRKTDHPHAH